MCGIVGLLIRNPDLRSELGAMAEPMFACMSARGPDSGGYAVFGDAAAAGQWRHSLYVPRAAYDWENLAEELTTALVPQSFGAGQGFDTRRGAELELDWVGNHGTLVCDWNAAQLRGWLREFDRSVRLIGSGRSMVLFKDAGEPSEIAQRYRMSACSGTHLVGHTRMATESAVTPAHSHPFTAGEDFCLVHNGSLSNPYMLRRALERRGVKFETDNDTEAACRFLEWRLRLGETLDEALRLAFQQLDGFYTLLMATAEQMTLVRDPFACKPAVVAETDDYVAVGSEFRALAHLPGVDDAQIYEPEPEQIYSWNV